MVMGFSISDHKLDRVRYVASPNCDERSPDLDIDLLVIHNISLPPGEFATGCIEQLFCNRLDCDAHPFFARLRGLTVSAHLLVDRHGEVTQFVPFDRRAWHAGQSSFRGRAQCNDYSIGIELEGTDYAPFTDAQYTTLVAVTRSLLNAYPGLDRERIVGHSDVAPGRKTDPGPFFDWQRFKNLLTDDGSKVLTSL